MSDCYLVGLDIGGGGGRCLLVDAETGSTTVAFRPWSFAAAPDGAGAGFDADLDLIWSRLGEASREAIARAGVAAGAVAGVAVTAFRFGTTVIDRDGAVLYAGPNRDARAVAQGIALASEHGAELAARTGRWPNPVFPLARLLWLAESEPQAFRRAGKVLSLNDWVAYRLCGELATDRSQAGESGIFSLGEQSWALDIIARLGLPAGIFPEVREAGSRLGALSDRAAGALGLRAGTPVAVGGADTQCGLLGVGAISAGSAAIIAGTTAPVQMVLERPVIDPDFRLWSGQHVMPGRFVLEANAGPVGEALDWFGRIIHPASWQPAAAVLGEADLAEPGAEGLFSTFGTQLTDGRRLRLPIGSLTFPHLLTVPSPGRAELARSVVEGLACALRKNLEAVLRVAGGTVGSVLLGGGLARSRVFAQLLSDVLGVEVRVADTAEATALGAAICAGAGAGVFTDVAAGAATLAKTSHALEPDPRRRITYEDQYQSWGRLLAAQAAADEVAQELEIRRIIQPRAERWARGGSRPRPRILVTAAMSEEGIAALSRLGDVEYRSFREHMQLLTGPTLVEALRGVNVFITEVDVVDVGSVSKARDLKVVATCRGDPVNVDIPGCSALGVVVLNAPGRNADAVADLTVAFALSLARKLPRASEFLHDEEIEAGDMAAMGQAFTMLQGNELWGKTFGLVGFGAVGRKVAARLGSFGARVIVSDPFVAPEEAARSGAELVSFDELLERSDFVSLHAPVTSATRGMIGRQQLAAMKRGAFFINTARSALVDEEALAEALESGHLAGAATDVFGIEPPGADHPLLQLENVIATPHVGGNTVEVATHQGRIIAEDLERLLDGKRPQFALNPECLDSFEFGKPRPEPPPEVLEQLSRRPRPAVSDLHKEGAPTQRAAAPAETETQEGEVADAIPRETRDIMARIIEAFVQSISTDAAIRAAATQDVTLHFTISDIGQEFFFGFAGGSVSAGVGAPPQAADVRLKMKAYILDGMFTGKVNAMEKAMAGELSFTGDAGKAMTLQQMQVDLGRLYQAARDATGDPGDLEKLAKAVAVRKRGGKGAGLAPAAGGPPARPRVGDERDEIVEIVDQLYGSQLITATGGNVSMRVAANPDSEVWITPSALFKGNLGPEILVRIDIAEGKPLDEDAMSPSSERMMHCAVYRNRPEVRAVIHAHAPNATVLANTGLPFLPISTEAAFFGEIPRLPFIMPGSVELARAVGEAMKEGWAVLLQNHGLIVAGRSLRRAADMVEIIERAAGIILGCYAVGREPPTLPEDVVGMLQKMGDILA